MGLPDTSPRQSGAPSSGRPVITSVRSPWSLTSARKESSVIELPFGAPRPATPWQDSQYVRYATSPRTALPADVAAYEGGLAAARIPGRPQLDRIPLVITAICLSVNIPPALCAKAGIAVPRAPLAMTLRITVSSAIARYTGSASAIAAPPFPAAPWQPAQFSAYRVAKSKISFGARTSESLRGWPCGEAQPESSIALNAAVESKCRSRLTNVCPRCCVAGLFPELQSPRAKRKASFHGSGQAIDA